MREAGLDSRGRRDGYDTPGKPERVRRFAKIALGVALLAVAVPPFLDFPLLGWVTLLVAGIYLLMLLVLPPLWLIVLPLATVALDVTPLTGRSVYNEFDLLVIVTLASGLFYNRIRFKVFLPTRAVYVLGFFLAIVMLKFSGWAFLIFPPGQIWQDPHFTPVNAFALVKSMVFGIALVPMWGHLLAVDKQRAVNFLVTGIALAAICLGSLVLWERGTFAGVLSLLPGQGNPDNWLSFNSPYRVTALFSEARTGSPVINGMVLLFLPAVLYAIAYGGHFALRLLGLAGFIAIAYVALLGFSIVTYFSFIAGMAVFVLLTYWYLRRCGMTLQVPLRQLFVVLGVAAFAAICSFRLAGVIGLAALVMLLLLAYLCGTLQRSRFQQVLMVCGSAILIGLTLYAHFTSRWVESSVGSALLLAAALVACLLLSYRLFRSHRQSARWQRFLAAGACIALPMLLAFGANSSQVRHQFAALGPQFTFQVKHWQEVASSSKGGIWVQLTGNGIGTYPVRYRDVRPSAATDSGAYSVSMDEEFNVLRLQGGAGFNLGQRVEILPDTWYRVHLRVRARQEGNLTVSLCERNIAYGPGVAPRCVSASASVLADYSFFQEISMNLYSAAIGQGSVFTRWPTSLAVQGDSRGAVIEIASIELAADEGNLLRNSNFSAGLDRWLAYHDGTSRPRHIDSIFLRLWFETGWLGLLACLALLALQVRSLSVQRAVDSLQPVYVTGVIGVCVLAACTSVLDSLRVGWIFWFLLAASLVGLRSSRKIGAASSG